MSLFGSKTTAAICVAFCLICFACSSTKHVPEGEMLLDKVKITVVNDSSADEHLTELDLINYLRQQPNHKVLGFAKLQLALYNLSGKDSTKWYNRWLRRMGQAPVVFDSVLTQASERQLGTALVNRGYMHPSVTIDSVARPDKKRISLNYIIKPGRRHTISSLGMECADPTIDSLLRANSASTLLSPGQPFDRNRLDAERGRISQLLCDNGYYAFTKEHVTFMADTAAGSTEVGLVMTVQPPRVHGTSEGANIVADRHTPYSVRKVIFITDYNSRLGAEDITSTRRDTVHFKDIVVLYGPDRYIRPSVLEENCRIVPGQPYNATDVDRTYQALSRLGILRFINIEMKPVATVDGRTWLDAYILLSRNKKQGITVELEGTNSEGDLGFGVGLTYQHRDLAHGSEQLTAKLRGAYESLSGDFEGLINNRYTEVAGEVGITFPKFKAPFLSRNFKQRINATTEFAISLNYQERPEYTRVIAGGAWKYKWLTREHDFNVRRTFDLIDINYVYLPRSTIDFIDQIAPSNPLLRYSYEDHFIMRMGYTYYRTNRRIPTATISSFAIQPSVTTLRASAEMAGNLLYAISSAVGQKRSDGAYKIFGIQYAQYLKGEVDFTYTRNFNKRNALAFHAGAGIAYPYGNSSMVPFEKRFYDGGANSVRGWSARTLGPGRYDARNSVTNFINQCGDIRLDLNLEYRAKLFWVFEGALFVDIGNIWTIHNYSTQPGGFFRFRNFYKELAGAYGIGLRMDFTYFLLRLDLGMKAHNPAMNQEEWPLIRPNWQRDATFHFAVGYPF